VGEDWHKILWRTVFTSKKYRKSRQRRRDLFAFFENGVIAVESVFQLFNSHATSLFYFDELGIRVG
jgi:hypothetical protein